MPPDTQPSRSSGDDFELVRVPDWAARAHDLIVRNVNKDGRTRRTALAAAFVYALLELADAIRERP